MHQENKKLCKPGEDSEYKTIPEKKNIEEHRNPSKDADDEEGSMPKCSQICKGYKSAFHCIWEVIKAFGRCVKYCAWSCCGVCWYPIKERCCNFCDDVDKELNPYKDPNYNPYDYL